MPPRPEQFPPRRERDEDDESSSGGKSARNNKRTARDAKRSGELLPLPEVPLKLLPKGSEVEAPESFDPAAYFETAKKAYVELGQRVQKIGIEPKEIVQVWGAADATLDEIKNFSKEYTEETNPGKKEEIAMLMQRLGTRLNSHGSVSDQIEDAARGFRNEKREEAPLAVTKPLSEKEKEEALGQALGHDIWNILSEPKAQMPEVVSTSEAKVDESQASKIEEPIPEEKDVDVSSTQAPQYMPRQRRESLQEEINSLGHTPETAAMAILVPAESPVQEETKSPEVASEAKVLEAEEQQLVDRNIEASHAAAASEEPTLIDTVSEEESASRNAKETGEHKKWGEFEDIEYRDVLGSEGTPKEWRDKLRGLIEGAKEKVSWYKSSEEKLIRRNAELDADLDKIGGTEKYFRGLGEWYNKRNWKTKLAVGASLGLGAAFSAGVSLPIALACMSGIAAQRIAGLSTMYLKFEKKSHEEVWGKEKAFLKAAVYTAVMGLAIKEGIEYVSETESAHIVQKWLGETLGHFSLFGGTHAPEHTASSREFAGKITLAPAIASEIPGIEVTATPGHGYEYMMKRLWEQLQEKHIQLPANANPDSDLAKLLAADKNSIGAVVHNLAQDNEFFKGDGTSAHINLDSKLSIDTKGQIWLDHENIIAPEESAVPTPLAEAPNAPSTLGDNTVLPEVAEMTPETNLQPSAEPVSEQAVPTIEGQESQISIESHETSVTSPASVENFEFSISTTEPHIYANEAKSLFVYGGSAEQKMKMITEYLTTNPDRVLYAEDANGHRVPWLRELGGKGEIIQGPVMRTSGLAGIFSSFMKAPSPDDLKTLVK